jgi:dihydroorotase
VIDPANGRRGRFDIAIVADRIAHVGHDLPARQARLVIDVSRYFVTPGLIDIDTHLQADHHSLRNGVTTVVDASGPSSFDMPEIGRAKTRLLAFVNPDAAGDLLAREPAMVVGVKAESASLNRALLVAAAHHQIVLLEGGEGMEKLRAGDIASQMFGRPAPLAEARKRGVILDIGHGSQGFRFDTARPALATGLLPDTVSSGIDADGILLQRADMMTTLSKLLNLGMTLDQLVERTTANPAKAIRRPELGTLREGAIADVAIIAQEQGQFGFLDSVPEKLVGDRRLRCVLTVRAGAIVWDSDGLAATDAGRAGPYSNFR